ncbi:DNA-binding domain-containing protein, AraC-type [Burkholderiales bacterium JOSHI_001]|nr:DNA-binding domain-containing protein, AraC-type [Burkholderiales bacterium JOSHI_001]
MTYRRETPIALVHCLLRAYRKYGVSPDAALAKAQIDPELLTDPRARITSRQLEVMTATTMRELDDEAMGMYSRRVPWGSLEMLMRASMTSPDLEVALRRWCRFRRSLIEENTVELTIEDDQACLRVHEHQPLGEARDFAMLSVLRHAHGMASWLVDTRLPLTGVWFPGPAPTHHRAYSVMFPGPVHFGATQASMRFAAEHLKLPVRRDDPDTRAVLQHTSVLSIKPFRNDRLLVQRLRAMLSMQADHTVTADELARALNLSTRSLHRKLAAEGFRLQQLKDEARQTRALELLAHRDLPIKRVATLLGFGSEKSFARSFERWTGQTPLNWREAATAERRGVKRN